MGCVLTCCPQVIVSLLAVAAFAGIALPALVYYTGWWGLVKYWLMPWLGYHFWMSAFTVVHHTAPHIPFKVSTDRDAICRQARNKAAGMCTDQLPSEQECLL
jgi:fatty acid desaturase